MKKTILIHCILIYILFNHQILYANDIVVNNNIIQFKNLELNLNNNIEEIMNMIDVNYEIQDIPNELIYRTKNFPINLFTDYMSNEITFIEIELKDITHEESYFIIIDNIKIRNDDILEDLIDIFVNLNISYEVESNTKITTLYIDDHRIFSIILKSNKIYKIQFLK